MKRNSLFLLFSISILIFSTRLLHAQGTRVENVRFQDLGESVLIQYDLDGRNDKKYEISLSLSGDNGVTFKIKPRSLTGDVGKNIFPGTGKKINWYYKEDFPGGLSGGGFVFAVDAELQKDKSKAPYVIGAAVVGGAAYFITAKKKGSDKGSIVVDVPDSY
jgi:hypothetical protein